MPSPATRERVTSLAEVLDAGLGIADAEGLEALSMRRLADELGIGAMTLYSYVQTKEELLEEIAALALAGVGERPHSADTWQSRLTAEVEGLYRALRTHPGAAEIVATRPGPIPALDRFRENLLAILAGAGFGPARSAQAVSALAAYAGGFAHVAQQRAGASAETEAARLRALPAAEYPHLIAGAAAYAGHVSDDAFALGLESFIEGLATREP